MQARHGRSRAQVLNQKSCFVDFRGREEQNGKKLLVGASAPPHPILVVVSMMYRRGSGRLSRAAPTSQLVIRHLDLGLSRPAIQDPTRCQTRGLTNRWILTKSCDFAPGGTLQLGQILVTPKDPAYVLQPAGPLPLPEDILLSPPAART